MVCAWVCVEKEGVNDQHLQYLPKIVICAV